MTLSTLIHSLFSLSLLFIFSTGCHSSKVIETEGIALVEQLHDAKSLEQKIVYLENLQNTNFDFEESIITITHYLSNLDGQSEERIHYLENIIDRINEGDMQNLAKILQKTFETLESVDIQTVEKALSPDEIVEEIQEEVTIVKPTPKPTPTPNPIIPQASPITNPDSAITAFETPVIIDILSNDTDINGDTLTVNGVETPTGNGTISINLDNTITYTPNTGFRGTDTFRYTVKDNQGGVSLGTVSVIVG